MSPLLTGLVHLLGGGSSTVTLGPLDWHQIAAGLLAILSYTVLLGGVAGGFFLLYSAWCLTRFTRRSTAPLPEKPPVTILKPLHGVDEGLEDNLRSFCQQDYPVYQIVFGIQDADDPARAVVEALMREFPALDMALVVSDRVTARNPKVSNLQAMFAAARHDTLVMADSDMRVTPDYLSTVTAPLADDAVGLVTCLYRGVPAPGLWSLLGSMHINYGFLSQALVGDATGTGAGCFGATIALRRETLDALGGFAAIADELADDHAIGQAVTKLGKRVVLSSLLVDTIVAEPTFKALFDHEIRWARTIRFIAPAGYASSVITHPVALATLALLFNPASPVIVAVFLILLLCRMAPVKIAERALDLPPTGPGLIIVRDLLSFVVFIASFASRTVKWRHNQFVIDHNRLITPSLDSTALKKD